MVVILTSGTIAIAYGGALVDRIGWRWIFWLLVILSGICLTLLCLLLPETARSIVGNGSTIHRGIPRNLQSILSTSRSQSSADGESSPKWRLRHLNFLVHLPLILEKTTFPILWATSVFYMI